MNTKIRREKIKCLFLFLTFLCLLQLSGWAQDTGTKPSRIISLDLNQLSRQLSAAPLERTTRARNAPLIMDLPMPDGSSGTFQVVESPIVSPDFAASYPDYKTYMVQDIENPAISGRISLTPYGFNAVILTPEGMIHARPLDINNPVAHEIKMTDLTDSPIECSFDASLNEIPAIPEPPGQSFTNGVNKRTYRLAIVTTGEFTAANGGTVPAAIAVVTASVNGIQAIYERELSVNFQLLLPFIYTDANNDPFTQGMDRTTMAASAVGANFNVNDYDIGHVFHDENQGAANLGSGGVANFGAVCSNTPQGTGVRKAGGWSGNFDNTSSSWISLAAHEFGHMFSMSHTFNGTGNNCTSNISTSAAYEIGSGTTIMSYNGSCDGTQNIPGSGLADHYFHAYSLEQAINFINGQTCEMSTPTTNTPPVVNANTCGGPYTIPVGTPFRLTGSGTDANGDVIYYTWEQYNEDGTGTPTQGFIGAQAAASATAPLFRAYPPTTNPVRYFPNQNLIAANNYASSFEPLPTVARTLNFRLTGRDWKAGGGGVHSSDLEITVSANGPLTVTSPNGGETLMSGNQVNVNWNHNGSNAFCNLVNIRLSIDGGLNFPYLLSTATANDGSEMVTLPAGIINTANARIMVESACNTCVVFFDISNANFNVTSFCNAPISNICPATAVNLPAGDGGLNFALTPYYGGTISQFNYALNANSPSRQQNNTTVQNGNICQNAGNFWYQEFKFNVSATGKYAFELNPNNPPGLVYFTVYQGDYNAQNPCQNFVGTNSWGTNPWFAQNDKTLDLLPCTEYTIVAWSLDNVRTGSILVKGDGDVYPSGGTLGNNYAYTYAAVNDGNDQVVSTSATASFATLPGGSYRIYGVSYYTGGAPPNPANPANWTGQTLSAILSSGNCVLFSNNFKRVTVVGACSAPTVSAPTTTQPTCNAMGTLVVNATGTGPFEYSVNNGATFQVSNTFNGLAPGNYNIVVRVQGNATCSTTYAQNPVTLNTPTGCDNCAMIVSADVPKNIVDNTTITSTINFPTAGTITDVNIKNMAGNHTYVGDLTFTLVSPQNTSVVLLATQCANAANFNISFDDQAATVITCPISDGLTRQPQNPLSVFNGQNPLGTWTLQVNDNANDDQGTLNAWTLEICGNFNCAPTINSVTVVQPTCNNPGGSITVNATGNGTLEYSIDNGTNFQLANTFNNITAGNYNVIARLQGNQACQAVYNQNPIVINAPTGCDECLTYNAGDLPIAITDNTTITSIINVPRSGTINDVNIRNMMGTHTYVSDLTFTLISPMGTSVTFLANQCASADDFNISFDDQAANAFACPMNDGQTKRPQNPFSAFNGQNPQGNWRLTVNDNANDDQGSLNGWTLEVCGNFVNAACPPVLDAGQAPIVSNGVYQAEIQVYCAHSIGAGNNVTFQAGNNVELRPNFEVQPNATLEVRIQGCNP